MPLFNEWESRIAYYDRTAGTLMDELYDSFRFEGQLEKDNEAEAPPGGPKPGQERNLWAERDKDLKRDGPRLQVMH